ncbi:hypothetical protein [Caenispirillum bisanense]|uniref:hypothetical protein n=1 Tax=Caenispirillum bisanense TaxID=414052 RepID=UPI0031D62382
MAAWDTDHRVAEVLMTAPPPPFLVSLGPRAEEAELIADAAVASGFDAVAVPPTDLLNLRLAAAAADVLVIDGATAPQVLAALPVPEPAEPAPLVLLVLPPDPAGAEQARRAVAGHGLSVVATLAAPLAEEPLRRALLQARAGAGGLQER